MIEQFEKGLGSRLGAEETEASELEWWYTEGLGFYGEDEIEVFDGYDI